MNDSLHNIKKYEAFEWHLDDSLGNTFEREIFQIINQQLAGEFDKGLRISQTPIGPDGGKDIIISTPIPITIFNQKFSLKNKREIKIYIECKSSNHKRIDFTKVAGSAIRVKDNNIDYYMLVSNSSFSPQTLFLLKSEFETAGIDFIIVDQYLLLKILDSENINLKNDPLQKNFELYYEYQVSSTRVESKNAYEIFFAYRNLTNEEQLITQKLLTDNNWSTDETERKFLIAADGSYINKFLMVRDFADGIDDLIFSVENNSVCEKQIKIEGAGVRPIFEPPFFGSNHKKCESFFIDRFKHTTKFDLCCIWGEAGIGKTRVFNEIYKKLNGQNLDFFSVAIRNNNKFLTDIEKFLKTKNYLNNNNKYKTLKDMLLASKNKYMRAIILLDDCHNISDNTLVDLKLLLGKDIPITIVLCGRTDYSVGTSNYYNFVHYTESQKEISSWKLTHFSDDDTKNFIRLIIKHIPNVVLDKIWQVSNNNPLFIIHFIEYLLELNLVEIYNRSSVGIINTNTFNSHLYIPNKVEEIYKKRIEYLLKTEPDSEDLLKYLYILSILQDRQSKEMALKCIPENRLNFLITRRFLDYSNDGEIIFSHESFALFIHHNLENSKKLKKNFANEIFTKYKFILKYISTPDKGVLACWAGKKQEAKEYFKDIIKNIEKTTNQSSFNVDSNTNKYLIYLMNLYANNKNSKEFLVKIIKTKIYTSIHHFSPVIAIKDCDEVIKFVSKNSMLKNDKCLYNSIVQQKAHAMIIAGYLSDAELLMQSILSDWILDKKSLYEETLFDLLDRFCGIYVDSNCKDLAINFNEMSKKLKIAIDNRLLAIVYLNTAKIHFLTDYDEAEKNLLTVQQLLKNGESKRILCSSKISYLMINLLHNKRKDYSNMIDESYDILKEASNENYAHSIARIYLILAVLYLLSEKSNKNFEQTKEYISKGIDYSIKLGFQREVWEFYNLLGIVQIRQGVDSEEIRKTFSTAIKLLERHDYLNLGMRDLCCDNILVISNIGFFYQSKKTEKEFYENMSKVSFWGDSKYHTIKGNSIPNEFLKKEYVKASKKQLLFTETPNNNLLRDSFTNYFIALS